MLERYRRRYQGQGQQMGALAFEEVHAEGLGADTAFARGVYAGRKPKQDSWEPHAHLVLAANWRTAPRPWTAFYSARA